VNSFSIDGCSVGAVVAALKIIFATSLSSGVDATFQSLPAKERRR
jgi:hypothetical protein